MAEQPVDNDTPTDTQSETTTERAEESADEPASMARRSFLQAGAAAGAFGIAGAGTASAAETVDIVQAGADPTGNEPINSVLESVVSNGTVVEFPSDGEFLLNGAIQISADNFELRGNGARLVQGGFDIFNVNGSGYLIDGFEIDLRQATQRSQLSLSGDGYTVRRIVFRGAPTDGKYKVLSIKTNGPDGATFEWIYFPDREYGPNEPYGTGYAGAFGDWNTYGGLTFRNCWFHGAGGTTFYMSQTKSRVVAENCYFRNTMNGPRIYNAELRNCTVVHDAEMMHKSGWNSGWMAGVWLNGKQDANFSFTGDPHVVIEDCDFYFTGPDPHGAGILSGSWLPGPITVRNSRIHNDTSVPAITLDSEGEYFDISLEGVEVSGNDTVNLSGNVLNRDVTTVSGEAADPTPPTETPPAEGSIPNADNSASTTSELDNDLRIEGTGVTTEYVLEVSDKLRGDYYALETWDETNGTTANGWITESGAVDRFTFNGEFVGCDFKQGEADVYVNDKQLDIGNDPSLANELEVRGIDVDTEYSFTVSDQVKAASSTLEGEDSVASDGTSASGTISAAGESDVYTFSGEVSTFDVATGEADVYVNGQLTDLGNAPSLTNELEVRGIGTDAQYSFTVSEAVQPDYATVESDDGISSDGTSASGTVSQSGESDIYTFDGNVTNFEFVQGEADVYVNGEQTTLGAEPELPNELVVEGTGTTTEYTFEVTEALEPGDDLENWDSIDGTTGTGWITAAGAVDTFRFAGDVASFEFLQGEADVYVNGAPLDQGSQPSLDNDLRIEGTGTTTEYAFEVTEALEGASDSLESWDKIDGTSATGWITAAGSVDHFKFAGEIASFEFVQGEADVYVNGAPLDQGSKSSSPSELEIRGTGTTTKYSFDVTGSLNGVSDSLESWDKIDGTSAAGWITAAGSVDRYTFEGDIASFEFVRGEAEVYVDGERLSVN